MKPLSSSQGEAEEVAVAVVPVVEAAQVAAALEVVVTALEAPTVRGSRAAPRAGIKAAFKTRNAIVKENARFSETHSNRGSRAAPWTVCRTRIAYRTNSVTGTGSIRTDALVICRLRV
jgi:hypothetical protein